MDIRDLIIALILGIVEGLTEFIPVSSTGHMIIVDDLLLQSHQVLESIELANTFKVVIQFGSVIAAIIIFRQRFIHLLTKTRNKQAKTSEISLTHFFISLLPALIFGLLLESFIDSYLFRIETVIIGLLLGAILMLAADQSTKETNLTPTPFEKINYKQALYIGLFQCLALWPGFSRSGATISGGVLLGLHYRAAADYTFMLAVPIMFGASALSLYKKWQLIDISILPFFTLGFVSAFIFAYLSIQFFLKLIEKIKLKPFAIYRIILASILIYIYYLNF